MFPSTRHRNIRQTLTNLQYGFSTVTRPNPLVFLWRWRYELILGVGLPAALFMLGGLHVMLATLAMLTALVGVGLLWAPSRRYLIARAWCVITPHRVRVGCEQAWIHSRYGKLPMVLFTIPQPFGERVHLWCRAGTSAIDFTNARLLLTAACWAHDIRVISNERHAHLVALDVIRHLPPEQPGNWPDGYPNDDELDSFDTDEPRPRIYPDDTDGPQSDSPSRGNFGPAA